MLVAYRVATNCSSQVTSRLGLSALQGITLRPSRNVQFPWTRGLLAGLSTLYAASFGSWPHAHPHADGHGILHAPFRRRAHHRWMCIASTLQQDRLYRQPCHIARLTRVGATQLKTLCHGFAPRIASTYSAAEDICGVSASTSKHKHPAVERGPIYEL